MASARERLVEILKRSDSIDVAEARQKEHWLGDLNRLRDQIRVWLEPLARQKLLTFRDQPFFLSEPDYGDYDAPGLVISVPGRNSKRVNVRPRGGSIVGMSESHGKRVLGAAGRVDLESASNREILLRFTQDDPTVWRSYSEGKERVLDEEVFFELFARVADVDLA